jgi:Multicopper oxidase
MELQAHSMNANRVQLLYPKAGDIEHWTYINEGGGWDHPIHLHFEEGITMNRGNDTIPATELMARKDVWRLRPSGRVQFQIQLGEYGGSYVNHCHNTVHEDFALLMRIQLLSGVAGSPQAAITATPNPTPDGVVFTTRRRGPLADDYRCDAPKDIERHPSARCHGGTDATKAVDGHRGVRGRDHVGAGPA